MDLSHNPYFVINGDITDRVCRSLTTHLEIAKGMGATDVHLLLNSAGGDLFAAYDAYTAIRGMKVPITTYNCGTVDSAATLIYLAADKRQAIPSASFTIHGCTKEYVNAKFNLNELYVEWQAILLLTNQMATIYAERTGLFGGQDGPIFELLSKGEPTHFTKESPDVLFSHAFEDLQLPSDSTLLCL